VETANIPHGLRARLVRLLKAALQSLERAEERRAGPMIPAAAAFQWSLTERPLASLGVYRVGGGKAAKGRGGAPQPLCQKLGRFIEDIQAVEHARRRLIPPSLAAAWIKSAREIASRVGCSRRQLPGGHSVGSRREGRRR